LPERVQWHPLIVIIGVRALSVQRTLSFAFGACPIACTLAILRVCQGPIVLTIASSTLTNGMIAGFLFDDD
jgi:hypothetical protein